MTVDGTGPLEQAVIGLEEYTAAYRECIMETERMQEEVAGLDNPHGASRVVDRYPTHVAAAPASAFSCVEKQGVRTFV